MGADDFEIRIVEELPPAKMPGHGPGKILKRCERVRKEFPGQWGLVGHYALNGAQSAVARMRSNKAYPLSRTLWDVEWRWTDNDDPEAGTDLYVMYIGDNPKASVRPISGAVTSRGKADGRTRAGKQLKARQVVEDRRQQEQEGS